MTARVIGLDARPYAKTRTGVERYAAHIAEGIKTIDPARELVFFSDVPVVADLPGRVVVVPPSWPARSIPVDMWLGRQLGPVLRNEGIDVFYSTSSKFCLGFPCSVTTVHGMEWWRCPDAYPRSQRVKQRIWMQLTLARAKRIICFAESTRSDIAAFSGRPATQVRIASEAAASHFRRLETIPPDPALGDAAAFVVLGTLEPRKNVDGILRAYARACQTAPDLPPLAIVGRDALRSDQLKFIAENEGIAARTHFLGFVDDNRLVRLLNRASALLYLSHYEGFGLPILESMACGAPVVTSDRSSMPEVAANAALLVDPGDESAMADAILRIASDPDLAEDLRRRGLAHCRTYSWERAASEVLTVLDEAYRDA